MNNTYLVIDDTTGKLITLSTDIIVAVEDARYYHETTKHRVQIYSASLMSEIKEQELEI